MEQVEKMEEEGDERVKEKREGYKKGSDEEEVEKVWRSTSRM